MSVFICGLVYFLFCSLSSFIEKRDKEKNFQKKKERRKREIKMHGHTKRCPRPTHTARDQPYPKRTLGSRTIHLHLSPILPRDLLQED